MRQKIVKKKRKKIIKNKRVVVDSLFHKSGSSNEVISESRRKICLYAGAARHNDFNKNFNNISNNYLYDAVFPAKTASINIKCYGFIEEKSNILQLVIKNLEHRSKILKKFIQLRNEYEGLFLFGKYKECISLLDDIEKIFGVTIWGALESIKCNYNIMNENNFKEYCERIKDKCKSDIVNILINYLVVKLQSKNIDNIIQYTQDLLVAVRSTKISWISNLLSLYLLPFEFDKDRLYQCPIAFLELPILDQFHIFSTVISDFYSADETDINVNIRQLESLGRSIEDSNLLNVALHTNGVVSCNYKSSISNVLKAYSTGSYKECIDIIVSELEKDPLDITYLEILAKSSIYTNNKSLPSVFEDSNILKLFNKYIDVVSLNNNCTDSIDEIQCLLVRAYPQRWTTCAYVMLQSIFYDYNGEQRRSSSIRLKLLGYPVTPLLFNAACDDIFAGCYKDTVDILEQIGLSKADMPEERKLRLEIKEYISNDIIDEEQILNMIRRHRAIETKFPYESYRLEIDYYKVVKNYVAMLDVIAARCVDFPEEFRCYPVPWVLEIIEKENYKSHLSSISFPIVHHIYNSKISTDKADQLNDAYELFTESRGSHKPTYAYEKITDLTPCDIYYLKDICTPDIMDISPFFESNDDLNAERVAILELLIAHGHPENKSLQNEINRIINRTIVEKSKASIDSCKIHVDIDSLVSKKYKIYENLYQTYKSYSDVTPKSNESDYITIEYDEEQFTIPKGDRNSIFVKIVREINTDFVTNPEYGLDKYLSTDIRHQTFLNLMRSSVCKHHLVTDRLDDGEYIKNNYWYEVYDAINDEILDEINLCLKEFSKQFDKTIITANNWMKVTFEDDDDHLFNFAITTSEFEELQSAADESSNFDDFFNLLIQFLWSKTNKCLDLLRNKINEDLKSNVFNLFDSLKQCINNKTHGVIKLSRLNDFIDLCMNDFIIDINTATSWLERRERGYYGSLDVSTLIEVAKSSYQAVKRDKKIVFKDKGIVLNNITTTEKEARAVIRSLVIAFDNAVRYGRYSGNPEVYVETHRNDDSFSISVDNRFDVERHPDVTNFFTSMSELLSDRLQISLVRTEKGTGLYKIAHLLSKASSRFTLKVELKDSDFFCVRIMGGL